MSLKPFCEVSPESKDARIARLERELEAAKSRISEARDWIPVSERVPDTPLEYSFADESPQLALILKGYQGWYVGEYLRLRGSDFRRWRIRGFGVNESITVTHWIPLPEAPKP